MTFLLLDDTCEGYPVGKTIPLSQRSRAFHSGNKRKYSYSVYTKIIMSHTQKAVISVSLLTAATVSSTNATVSGCVSVLSRTRKVLTTYYRYRQGHALVTIR